MSPAVEGKSTPPSAKRARFERSTVDLREETAGKQLINFIKVVLVVNVSHL